MPEGVVVKLEAVEIADQHTEGACGSRERQLASEVVDELPAVAEAGERVREGLLPTLRESAPQLELVDRLA